MKKIFTLGIICLSFICASAQDTTSKKSEKLINSFEFAMFDKNNSDREITTRAMLSREKNLSIDGLIEIGNEQRGTIAFGVPIKIGKIFKITPAFGISYTEYLSPMLQIKTKAEWRGLSFDSHTQIDGGLYSFATLEAKHRGILVGGLMEGSSFTIKIKDKYYDYRYTQSFEYGPYAGLIIKKFAGLNKVHVKIGELFGNGYEKKYISSVTGVPGHWNRIDYSKTARGYIKISFNF
jgi:hypothetical protein